MSTRTNSRVGRTSAPAVLPYKLKSVSQARKDIKDLKIAKAMALDAESPSNWLLQSLLNNIMDDNHLESQVSGRKEQVFSSDYQIYLPTGAVDKEATLWARKSATTQKFVESILDANYYGYSLAQLSYDVDGKLDLEDLPRKNAVPQLGVWYEDYSDPTRPVHYRDLREYGVWLFEFNKQNLGKEHIGLLVKAIAHALMKRFAQSCWSELCEIYGIPPRFMKTHTSDPGMLNRADQMMRDMGAAAYFIIDKEEELEFAQGVSTDGSVYDNLIRLCNNEMSLLISGAIVGQDTKYGSESKEKAAQDLLWLKVQADMRDVQTLYTNKVIPALAKHGVVKEGSTFQYDKAEDINNLMDMVSKLLNHYYIDPKWIFDKFGIHVQDKNIEQPTDTEKKLHAIPERFFD
ncbi:phage portal protein family protein [Sphingobacterium hotanense]|uniref:DUF935 family protein n=1 Tax=Sphingobacterium hotanense TaxID=649196 RepID=A0ABT7NLE9_9SPHI|nr:DUF935 family protein [Sphingobacterium hotanense]MDM1048049.1 DUF935 family protein [Sphingobacterium hotanense]